MKRAFAIVLVLAGFAAGPVTSASASPDRAGAFVRLINLERVRTGKPALRVHTELATYAQRHSRDMAATDSIWHTRSLSRAVSVGTVVGENVGYGSDVEDLHAMFMDSTTHRANILYGDYDMVGVGVVEQDDWLFVTVIFAGSPQARRATIRPTASSTPLAPASPPPINPDRLAGAANQASILRQLQALDATIGTPQDLAFAPVRSAWVDAA